MLSIPPFGGWQGFPTAPKWSIIRKLRETFSSARERSVNSVSTYLTTTMTPLFKNMDDFATQGGVITDYEFICDMMNQKHSLMDLIEPEVSFDEEEYRDEREDSSRLADRYHCWCILTARDITCAANHHTLYITCASDAVHAAYHLRPRSILTAPTHCAHSI